MPRKYHQKHRSMTNKIIQLLEEHPCTRKEINASISPCRMSIENRDRIRQIRVAGNRSKTPGHGLFRTVYYLRGDEDRAVKMFIEVNAESLQGLDLSRNTALDSGLSREMAQKVRGAML